MIIFNSYVKLPEGILELHLLGDAAGGDAAGGDAAGG